MVLTIADDAVQPNTLLNLPPGAVFVHRNIGNLFGLKDLSSMAVVEYAVTHLKARRKMMFTHKLRIWCPLQGFGCGDGQEPFGRTPLAA